MNNENVKNIFSLPPETSTEEVFETIIENNEQFRLERIVSKGHITPEGFWYDQDHDEWVLLIAGSATLLFESTGRAVDLKPGDFLNIPAHERHRVVSTDKDRETVWLALHYHKTGNSS